MGGHGCIMRVDRGMDGMNGGFTLIEVFVVVSIVILLVGMLTPMLIMAQREAAKTNTRSLMQKVSGGVNMFRLDVGGFPYQAWDVKANPPPAADLSPPVNNLAYRLCRDLTAGEMANLRADINTAGDAYESGGAAFIPASSFNMPKSTNWVGSYSTTMGSLQINRVAKQWATANVMVGNVQVGMPTKSGSDPWVYGASLLIKPMSNGYASDYLSRDVPVKNISGDAIVDMWGNSLVYVCPVQPGVESFLPEGVGFNFLDTGWFAMAPRSFRRATLSVDSDIRDSAAERFIAQPEIWSAGPDRLLSSRRPEAVNKDNIAAFEYNKELR